MDPLSIIAAALAIGSFTTESLKVILKIRGASDEVQALINEISDLSAIIKDVEHTLRYTRRLDMGSTGLASLQAVLEKANTTIGHLHSFVGSVLMKEESLLRNARISRTTWLREKPQVSKYQRQLLAIKLELLHALGIANLSTSGRIELSLANVVDFSDHSRSLIDAQSVDTHGLREEVRDIRHLISLTAKADCSAPPPLHLPKPSILPQHSRSSGKDADVSLEGRRRLEVQVVWRPPWACDISCHCLCHETTHGRSPESLDRLFGILFWGYSGLPIARKSCDVTTCQRRRGLKFGISYFFPAWFVEKKIDLTFRSMPLGEPQMSIKMVNIVSNGALLFKYTQNRDVSGIQSLFAQGLASPSDAGHLDGCAALHIAVGHGSIEVIDFLIKTGAECYALNTHLDSPATNAWDIILGNAKDQKVVEYLRATFSDRDFVEEQNFHYIHQVVLGLNIRPLAEALKERPLLIDCPDTRGNTPLIWAATRGDTQNLQELLKHGADPEFTNDNGWNALRFAVHRSRLDCATILLSYGYTDYKDGYGMTALHPASQSKDAAFVKLLLQHDVNKDEQDIFQRAPIALAAWRNNAAAVAYLLDRGANGEVCDIFSATPLLRAVQYAAADAASVLLDFGCNVLAVDHELQTLLHWAVLSRDSPTIELLTEKSYLLSSIDINARDRSGKPAKQQLQTVEPSANLLQAFTRMIAAIESARQASQEKEKAALVSGSEHDQDIFKDAIEYLSDVSPNSSCRSSDYEELSVKARRARARLTKPLKEARRNWASKYRNTFRSFDRHSGSASASTVKLIAGNES